jgi:Holliday junction resolvasome RuvABC endonuclease subunit
MMRRHLMELFDEIEPIEELGFELVQRHSGTYAGQIYGELRGVLMSVCEEMSIPYRSIGVTTIKKHMCGIGIASKDIVRQAVVEKYPDLDPQTEDEADAISILQCVMDGVF